MWVRIPPGVQKLIVMITKIIVKIKNGVNGVEVNYLEKTKSFYRNEHRQKQHKCRIKEVIYGGVFTYYSDTMDFTYSLSNGGKFLIDNR